MKKGFIFLGLVSATIAYSQTGSVGINTEKPTETLQVEGTLRVTELPLQNEMIYTKSDGTASEQKDQTYTPSKMVVVDANGVFGKADIPTGGGSSPGSGSTGAINDGNTYTGSASIALEGNSFQREALTGDVIAGKNSNETKVVGMQGQPISSIAPKPGEVLMWKTFQETNPKTQAQETVTKWVPSNTIPRTDLVLVMQRESSENINDNELGNSWNPKKVPNLEVILDKNNLYKTNDHSFNVLEDGLYEITMSVLVKNNASSQRSVCSLGLWDDTANQWKVKGTRYIKTGTNSEAYDSYTFIGVANLKKSNVYSFRINIKGDVKLSGHDETLQDRNPEDLPYSTLFSITRIN
ncbi:MAG: hypothetical protein Q4A00_04430 [Flavobacteriaceae bacterium]|nr:hypothetical protein [Flavobacteriaceae bacterium]